MIRAVARGASLGLLLIVPLSLVTALVERGADDVDESGWRIPLFFGLLVVFAIAGWTAGRALPDRRLTVGILGALGSVALWIPVRVVIWAMRDDDRGLVVGSDAVLRPGQVFAVALFACTLGLLGGFFAGRPREVGR